MLELLHNLIAWIGRHPELAGFLVFLVAMGESLAFVGLLVPGAAIMVGTGALIATGTLTFWPVMAWAVAGAIAGDGLSFWLGRHYRDRLRTFWPFRRYPDWLDRGERFFYRHGAKSIIFGRFVGPVRPVIPIVAGMLGMRPALFLAVNVLSAIGWAPAYLLPGMAVGASLALAGEVATRLALLLGLSVALIWFTAWAMHRLYRWWLAHMEAIARRTQHWASRHPRLGRPIRRLLDPAAAQLRPLTGLALVLLVGAGSFLAITEDLLEHSPLQALDHNIFTLLQGLRTPLADRLMVAVTELGDLTVLLPLAGAVLAMLLWQRRWRTTGYWLAAVAFGLLATVIFKLVLPRARPIGLHPDNNWLAFAFPSSHAVMSAVIYGFLVTLVAREIRPPHRWPLWSMLAVLLLSIDFSRLYLGAHWFSDVIAGLGLGLAWVALLTIALRIHLPYRRVGVRLPLVATAVWVVSAGWHIAERHQTDMQRYAPRVATVRMAEQTWWLQDWRRLPRWRTDLGGETEQRLNLQWAGSLDAIRQVLQQAGWQRPPVLDFKSAVQWLVPGNPLSSLPVLPLINHGHFDALRLIRPTGKHDRQWVLRLWPTRVRLQPGDRPLWIGNITEQRLENLTLVHYPRTLRTASTPLQALPASVGQGVRFRMVSLPTGRLLLAAPAQSEAGSS